MNKLVIEGIKNNATLQDDSNDFLKVLLAKRNSLPDLRESKVSPACIEGHALYPDLVRVNGVSAMQISEQSWFVNQSLNENSQTVVSVSFETTVFSSKRISPGLLRIFLQKQRSFIFARGIVYVLRQFRKVTQMDLGPSQIHPVSL